MLISKLWSITPRSVSHLLSVFSYLTYRQDAAVWVNLGLLYLDNNDRILANEAFFRAQTLDPDYTAAWVGQGLVATANGHEIEARALFEHAVTLSADIVSPFIITNFLLESLKV